MGNDIEHDRARWSTRRHGEGLRSSWATKSVELENSELSSVAARANQFLDAYP